MIKSITYPILCCALLGLGQYSGTAAEDQTQKESASAPLARAKAVLVSATAKVTAIDPETREITLKGPLGNEETYIVDKQVKRLNEVKPGDTVALDYYVSVAAELRKPTPEEEANPFMILDAQARAPKETSPAGANLRCYKAVMTVEGLDRPTETMTVKGPKGGLHTVKVENPKNLTKMRIGDK